MIEIPWKPSIFAGIDSAIRRTLDSQRRRRKVKRKVMAEKIYIPEGWAPLVDDAGRLMMLADWFSERGGEYMAKLCRWTANEWTWHRSMRRDICRVGMDVWARYGSQGWSEALIEKVGQFDVEVSITGWTQRHVAWSYNGDRMAVTKMVKRAWWDLIPRTLTKKRPKARRGYGIATNVAFAAALMGCPEIGECGSEKDPGNNEPMMIDGTQRALFAG